MGAIHPVFKLLIWGKVLIISTLEVRVHGCRSLLWSVDRLPLIPQVGPLTMQAGCSAASERALIGLHGSWCEFLLLVWTGRYSKRSVRRILTFHITCQAFAFHLGHKDCSFDLKSWMKHQYLVRYFRQPVHVNKCNHWPHLHAELCAGILRWSNSVDTKAVRRTQYFIEKDFNSHFTEWRCLLSPRVCLLTESCTQCAVTWCIAIRTFYFATNLWGTARRDASQVTLSLSLRTVCWKITLSFFMTQDASLTQIAPKVRFASATNANVWKRVSSTQAAIALVSEALYWLLMFFRAAELSQILMQNSYTLKTIAYVKMRSSEH